MRNNNIDCFCELSECERSDIRAGGLGLCIIGTIGGTLTGGLAGAVVTYAISWSRCCNRWNWRRNKRRS